MLFFQASEQESNTDWKDKKAQEVIGFGHRSEYFRCQRTQTVCLILSLN